MSERVPFYKIALRALKLAGYGQWKLLWGGQAIGVLHGLSWAVAVWGLQMAFDAVADAVSGARAPGWAYMMLCVYGFITIIQQVLNGVHNFLSNKYFSSMKPYMTRRLAEKAARISPLEYENPARLNDINKAAPGAENVLDLMFTLVNIPVFYLPYFLFLTIYLYAQKPELAISTALIFAPAAFSQLIRAKVFTKLEDEAAPIRRRFEYYEKTVSDREFFKETRTLGAFRYFIDKYNSARRDLNMRAWRAERKTFLLNLAMTLATLAGYMGILYMLFSFLMAGEISIGVFASVFANLGTMFGIMEEVVCRHIGRLSQDVGTVKNYIAFMDLPERAGDDISYEGGGVRLENAGFTYPGAPAPAVSGVNLQISDGETIAIVGENGAGKTTLVRLLCGLYPPSEGRVLLSGRDTREAGLGFRGISAVFQKYQRYKLTLEKNVTISTWEKDETRLARALTDAGVDEPPETLLSREFGGTDISGGEWQRVAIARALYRPHGFIVLDEPTAAIDPLEETRLYKKFAEISKRATAFIVTHRMGSARIADRVVVMDKGRVAEVGTHEELMEARGKYYELVMSQKRQYD